MANKPYILFVAVFIVGIISLIGAYAYKGDSNIVGPNYNEDVHEALETAIENQDYDAWVKIREDNNLPMNGRMFQAINKDNFALLSKMHEANEKGDIDTANAIRSEIGLGQGMMNHGSMDRGLQEKGNKGSNNGGNFVDADNDGACDNYGSDMRIGRR